MGIRANHNICNQIIEITNKGAIFVGVELNIVFSINYSINWLNMR